MRDFTRYWLSGLLTVAGACQEEIDTAALTSKGGPHEPDEHPSPSPSPPAPSPPDPTPTSTADAESSGTTNTSTGDPGTGDLPGSTGVSDPSTGVPPGTCGDGVVDPGEQCDASYQSNSDAGACTAACLLATCGDGLVWTGEEQCDEGPSNNDETYAGCTQACKFGERCGDGGLQPDHEECDASAPAVEGLAPCDPDVCKFKARVTFVTAAMFTGAFGGLALADAACASAAASAGLDNANSFKAWLSDGVTTPLLRLKNAAADPGYPYTRRDGLLLADDLADLIAHGPKLPLDVTETGAKLPAEKLSWTNIGADGQPFSAVNHCKEWTNDALLATARAGKVSPATLAELPPWQAAHRWTSDAMQNCITPAHLYCFED